MTEDQPACPRPGCGRPIHDQAYVCTPCTNRLRDRLELVAAVADATEDTIARLSRTGTGGRSSAEPPLPFAWQAADDFWAGMNTLTTWARHISETRGSPPPAPLGPVLGPPCTWRDRGCAHGTCEQTRTLTRAPQLQQAVVALWLAAPPPQPGTPSNLDWLRHRAEAAEAFDELHYACTQLVNLVDNRPDRWYAGPCGAEGCDAELHPVAGATTIRCYACGATHDGDDRKAWLLDQADDQLAHATWIASTLTRLGCPVKAATVWKWAERGLVVAHGTDGQGRPVYRLGEVRAAVLEAERREHERVRRATERAAKEGDHAALIVAA